MAMTASAASRLVRTVVIDPSKDDSKTFSLDPKKYSPLYITNHLWDLME